MTLIDKIWKVAEDHNLDDKLMKEIDYRGSMEGEQDENDNHNENEGCRSTTRNPDGIAESCSNAYQ